MTQFRFNMFKNNSYEDLAAFGNCFLLHAKEVHFVISTHKDPMYKN